MALRAAAHMALLNADRGNERENKFTFKTDRNAGQTRPVIDSKRDHCAFPGTVGNSSLPVVCLRRFAHEPQYGCVILLKETRPLAMFKQYDT